MSMHDTVLQYNIARWIVAGLCLCWLVASSNGICSGAESPTRDYFWAGENALYIVDPGRHWVFAIDRTGKIVWSAGKCGELGEVEKGLFGTPSFVQVTEDTLVVADAAQGVIVEYTAGEVSRVIDLRELRISEEQLPEIRSVFKTGPNEFLLVDRNLHVVLRLVGKAEGERITWEFQTCFGAIGKSGRHDFLYSPVWAQPLHNGNIAIADALNHRVIETDGAGNVIRQHGNDAVGTVNLVLDSPTCVSDVGDGEFLICDTGHRRVIQVDSSGDITWEISEIKVPADLNSLSSVLPLVEPVHAVRLKNGSTLITDRMLGDIYEVNAAGELVWSYNLFRLQWPSLPRLEEPWMAVCGPMP